MAHLITAKGKILTPGEFHCCSAALGGRTPTETDITQGTVGETTTGSPVVTTWSLSDGDYFLGDLYFTICCYDKITITIGEEITPFSRIFVSVNGSEVIANEEILEETYVIDSTNPTVGGDFPPDACGMEIKFEVLGDRVIDITLETA